MMRINEVLDRLIKRVKKSGKLAEVCFVQGAKQSQPAENPVREYIAACRSEVLCARAGFLQGADEGEDILSLIEGKAQIQLLAPQGTDGRRLSQLSQCLVSELLEADTEGYIVRVEASQIYYSSDVMTLCQDLTAHLSFVQKEEKV